LKAADIISHLDQLLRTSEITDVSHNGLQVEGSDEIRKIGFAVDASELSFVRAAELHCDLLVVHHGLLWKEPVRLTGPHYRRIKILIEHHCGLYASHLPLDLHPEYGNNIQICRALALQNIVPFGDYHGIKIGFGGTLASPLSADALMQKLTEASGNPLLGKILHHHGLCTRIAVVSGGAPELSTEAAAEGYDTFITGDVQHETAAIAREYGINIISGGHYATETFGVKALMQHIHETFSVETVFIDIPTGL
jgi:dinuclear metal center YbgI/SA1388 family protein